MGASINLEKRADKLKSYTFLFHALAYFCRPCRGATVQILNQRQISCPAFIGHPVV